MIWIRKCQECGNTQKHSPAPNYGTEPSDSYKNTKCRKCKSESLDYGSAHELGCTLLTKNTCSCIEETED